MYIAHSYLIVDDTHRALGFCSRLQTLDCRLFQRCRGSLRVAPGTVCHHVSLSVVLARRISNQRRRM
jgi:hypothetical protein